MTGGSDKEAGVVIGKVLEVEDPEGLGRIRVRYPWLSDVHTEWVSVASVMAGNDRGVFFMPEKDDEVLVAFQQGRWDNPFVIGFVWNAVQKPPSSHERQRMIRSKNGHTIRFVDSTPNRGDMGALIIEDAHGNHVTMSNGKVSILSKGHLEISALSVKIMGRKVRTAGGDI